MAFLLCLCGFITSAASSQRFLFFNMWNRFTNAEFESIKINHIKYKDHFIFVKFIFGLLKFDHVFSDSKNYEMLLVNYG